MSDWLQPWPKGFYLYKALIGLIERVLEINFSELFLCHSNSTSKANAVSGYDSSYLFREAHIKWHLWEVWFPFPHNTQDVWEEVPPIPTENEVSHSIKSKRRFNTVFMFWYLHVSGYHTYTCNDDGHYLDFLNLLIESSNVCIRFLRSLL